MKDPDLYTIQKIIGYRALSEVPHKVVPFLGEYSVIFCLGRDLGLNRGLRCRLRLRVDLVLVFASNVLLHT